MRCSIFRYSEHIERAFSASTVEGIVTHLGNEIPVAEEAGLDPAPLKEMLSSMAAACPLSLKVTLRRMQSADQPLPEKLLKAMRGSRMDEEQLTDLREYHQETIKAWIQAEAEVLGMTGQVAWLEALLVEPARRKIGDWLEVMVSASQRGVDTEALKHSLLEIHKQSYEGWLQIAKHQRLLTDPPEAEDGSRFTMLMSLADTLQLDFRMTQHFLTNPNFLEGVCALCACGRAMPDMIVGWGHPINQYIAACVALCLPHSHGD